MTQEYENVFVYENRSNFSAEKIVQKGLTLKAHCEENGYLQAGSLSMPVPMRYRKHSYQGLYHFIQLFVVSNGVDTKYFANSDKDILYSHTFFWTDDNNIRVTNLKDFSVVFLARDLLTKMLTKFTILNDTDKPD